MTATDKPNPKRSWARIDGVDLLRGLAIFFVLMNHVNMRLLGAGIPYTRGLPRQIVASLVWNGQFGVQIFFAVSGFLITSTALRRWGSLSKVNVRQFYQLRFARIAPLMLALLLVLSGLHVAGVHDFVVSRETGGLGHALLAAFTFRINVLEARWGYLPGNWDILWSLSVEEMFYLFFPLVCRVFRRGKLLAALLFVFVALGPFARSHAFNHNPVWREYSYLGGMDAIALGCLTAVFLASHTLTRQQVRIASTIGVIFLALVLMFSVQVENWGLGRNGLDMTILAVGACLVIAAVTQTKWQAPRVFLPLLMLGRRSYEVYLTHMFVVFALFGFFVKANKPMWAVPALFLAVTLLAAVLGELVARWYSEPVNLWLRKKWGDGPASMGTVLGSSKPANLQDSAVSVSAASQRLSQR